MLTSASRYCRSYKTKIYDTSTTTTGAGGIPRDAGATETPETPTRGPAEASENCDRAAGRDLGNGNADTARTAADTRASEAMGAVGAPRRADKGSAGTAAGAKGAATSTTRRPAY